MISSNLKQPFEANAPRKGKQRILVFQQRGSGNNKIRGISRFGGNEFSLDVVSIDDELPPLIDDTSPYLNADFEADLVLDYLKHQDLSHDLSVLCNEKNIPVVAPGKKNPGQLTHTPPICCALPRKECLERYAEMFGAPIFSVTIFNETIEKIEVMRGAPCGATWEAAKKMAGVSVAEAPIRMGLEVQFFCTANPAGWDVINEKSPVHLAGEIHSAALVKAIKKCRRNIS